MTAADLDRLSSAFDSSIRQVCWQMVAADQWRLAAAASTRCHDGHHRHAQCCCRERQHSPRWRFGAATLCSRRVRAAAAAEWPTCSGPCARWANGMRAWLVVILAYSLIYARDSAAILAAWPLRGARWPRQWSDLLVPAAGAAAYAKKNRNIRACTVWV